MQPFPVNLQGLLHVVMPVRAITVFEHTGPVCVGRLLVPIGIRHSSLKLTLGLLALPV